VCPAGYPSVGNRVVRGPAPKYCVELGTKVAQFVGLDAGRQVRVLGARLAALAMSQPAGRVPDLAGPEICTIEDLARTYLTAVGKRRPIVSVPLPGRVCRAYRAGGHLAPARAVGTIAVEQYLGEQLAAGTLRPGVSCRTRTLASVERAADPVPDQRVDPVSAGLHN
jgi:hypothetical protein